MAVLPSHTTVRMQATADRISRLGWQNFCPPSATPPTALQPLQLNRRRMRNKLVVMKL